MLYSPRVRTGYMLNVSIQLFVVMKNVSVVAERRFRCTQSGDLMKVLKPSTIPDNYNWVFILYIVL